MNHADIFGEFTSPGFPMKYVKSQGKLVKIGGTCFCERGAEEGVVSEVLLPLAKERHIKFDFTCKTMHSYVRHTQNSVEGRPAYFYYAYRMAHAERVVCIAVVRSHPEALKDPVFYNRVQNCLLHTEHETFQNLHPYATDTNPGFAKETEAIEELQEACEAARKKADQADKSKARLAILNSDLDIDEDTLREWELSTQTLAATVASLEGVEMNE